MNKKRELVERNARMSVARVRMTYKCARTSGMDEYTLALTLISLLFRFNNEIK